MANPWIEHVKQKAKELDVSYACAISLPEVRKSYKPKAKPSKPTKPRKKTEQKRMAMEDIDVPPPKPVAKKAVVKKAVVKKATKTGFTEAKQKMLDTIPLSIYGTGMIGMTGDEAKKAIMKVKKDGDWESQFKELSAKIAETAKMYS